MKISNCKLRSLQSPFIWNKERHPAYGPSFYRMLLRKSLQNHSFYSYQWLQSSRLPKARLFIREKRNLYFPKLFSKDYQVFGGWQDPIWPHWRVGEAIDRESIKNLSPRTRPSWEIKTYKTHWKRSKLEATKSHRHSKTAHSLSFKGKLIKGRSLNAKILLRAKIASQELPYLNEIIRELLEKVYWSWLQSQTLYMNQKRKGTSQNHLENIV